MTRRFLPLCFASLFALAVIGCKNETPQPKAQTEGVVISTLDIPMPTEEMLVAIGQENNLPIDRLLPNTFFVITGKPKQFLASPIATDGEQLVRSIILQSLHFPYFAINPDNIDFFIISEGMPMPTQVIIPNSQDPTAPPHIETVSMRRRSTILTFAEPFNLYALLGAPEEFDASLIEERIEARKNTIGRTEYYDLTPQDEILPQHLALHIVDDRTVIIVQGIEEDITAVFSDTVSTNPVLQRLKHTPVHSNDLMILTSLEGFPFSQEMFERIVEEAGIELGIPQVFVPLISQNLRALTLSFNLAAAEGQPIVSAFIESRDEQSAQTITETILGTMINSQTSIAAMSEEAKQFMQIPADLLQNILRETSIERTGTQVHLTLNNFTTLIPTLAGHIGTLQVFLQEEQLRIDGERFTRWLIGWLGQFAAISESYYETHGTFPHHIVDADGTPLLSWRVAMLPMMELNHIYDQFNLEEPWDSETNLHVLQTVPNVFLAGIPNIDPTKTVIRFFASPGTPLANRNLKHENLEHPEMTLQFVLVGPNEAVEWTRPEHIEFDINSIPNQFGGLILGVSFSGNIISFPVLPDTDHEYTIWARHVEAMVKDLPLPE